ncbi:MAG: FtsX-like permease family protein [Desulfarculus sp.]|nr:MAG: FtsX-like permease family protein [Desulfarculus sp.]
MSAPASKRGPLSRALMQMREDLWLQGVAISTLTVALAIMGVYLVVAFNLHQSLAHMLGGPSLTLVLAAQASPQRGQELAAELSRVPQVKQARYVDRAEALERFRRQLGPHRRLLDDLQENPLPDTVEVVLAPGIAPGQELMAQLQSRLDVAEVVASRPWLHRLEQAANTAGDLALALGILLFLGVVLMVSNTVRLAVHARRDHLELMALVGATRGYMRRPFLVEAVLQGLAAAALASLVVWALSLVLSAPSKLPLGLQLQQLVTYPRLLPLVLAGLAVLAGLMGGFLGVGRTLRLRGSV